MSLSHSICHLRLLSNGVVDRYAMFAGWKQYIEGEKATEQQSSHHRVDIIITCRSHGTLRGRTIIRLHPGYDRIRLAIWKQIHLKLSEPQNSTIGRWHASCLSSRSWAGPGELWKYLNWRIPLTHTINNVTDDDLTAAPALAAPQTKVTGGRVKVRERAPRDDEGRMNVLRSERYYE